MCIRDRFDYWRTVTSFSALGASFTHTLYLTRPQTNSYQILVACGIVGDVTYNNTVRFDMADGGGFYFGQENLQLSFMWSDLQAKSMLNITDAGFQKFTLKVNDYPISRFVTPDFGLYLDLALSFTPTGWFWYEGAELVW